MKIMRYIWKNSLYTFAVDFKRASQQNNIDCGVYAVTLLSFVALGIKEKCIGFDKDHTARSSSVIAAINMHTYLSFNLCI
jgi:Ulp1 family protease